MVNKELIELCQTVIGAVQETDNFDAPTLRKLLIHIVPQLLAELDILNRILETVRLPEPPTIEARFDSPKAVPFMDGPKRGKKEKRRRKNGKRRLRK